MILALDLEGTLISSAMVCWARPGLLDFLEWAKTRFPKIVIFTAVPEDIARRIPADLAELGEMPAWFKDVPILMSLTSKRTCPESRRLARS